MTLIDFSQACDTAASQSLHVFGQLDTGVFAQVATGEMTQSFIPETSNNTPNLMLEKKIFTFEDVTNLMVIVFCVPLQDRALRDLKPFMAYMLWLMNGIYLL